MTYEEIAAAVECSGYVGHIFLPFASEDSAKQALNGSPALLSVGAEVYSDERVSGIVVILDRLFMGRQHITPALIGLINPVSQVEALADNGRRVLK